MGDWTLKKIGIVGGVVLAILLLAFILVLYRLGGSDESALTRLRDISIIFSQLLMMITVVLLAAITGALIWLTIKVKDQVIPMLDEALGILQEFKGTAGRVSDTTSFMTEEMVKPFVTMSGQLAKIRKMGQIVSGKSKDLPDPPTFTSGHSGKK